MIRARGAGLAVLLATGALVGGAAIAGARPGHADSPASSQRRPPAVGALSGVERLSARTAERAGANLRGRGLADSHLERAVRAFERGRARPADAAVLERNGKVLVDITARDHTAALHAAIMRGHGRVAASLGKGEVEAWVPLAKLRALARSAAVGRIRTPTLVNALPGDDESSPDVSLGPAQAAVGTYGAASVVKSNASAWHNAGWKGTGIKVGIVDSGFHGATWNNAAAAGELPTSAAGTFCRAGGQTCSVWSGDKHGVAVAEVIHDQAPAAKLYLASVVTAGDLKAAVNYFVAQGVRILSRSLTAYYDGPGDGTGTVDDVVNYAVSKGITWFNSAGNSAGNASNPGTYWRGGWSDPDHDNYLNFAGDDELLKFDCAFINGFRWDDWGATRTDYNVYLYDDPNAAPVASSTGNQATQVPIELLACPDNLSYASLAVYLYSSGNGTSDDTLEFMTNGYAGEYWTNPYSVTSPASDTKNHGAMSVGAVDPVNGTTIAVYSSRGPTNDGRRKPNMSAAANMSSYSYYPEGFSGTSAATPVTAGAAALVLQAYPGTTPSELITYLQGSCVVDRGAVGPDNTYGTGELRLPAPPGKDATPPTVQAPVQRVRLGSKVGQTVRTTVSWAAATDASGIARYDLWASTNGSDYAQQTLSDPTARSVDYVLTPGTTYQFALRARDKAGNWSGYRYGPVFTQAVRDDGSSAITYSGAWTRYARSYAYGGYARFTQQTSAWARLTFTGRGIAWVGTKSPTSGRARVWVDGVDRGVIDLYRATTSGHVVLFSARVANGGGHTIRVVRIGTPDRPWVDVDAFVVTS